MLGRINQMKIKHLIVLGVLTTLLSAIEDTPENRRREAQRYMKTTPAAALFADMAEQVAKNLPPEQRDAFKAILNKNLDQEAIAKAISDAMVKHFTADELNALADFYGSDVGKSAMKKIGAYMADAMPSIQAEMTKAMAKTNKQLPDKTKK